MVPQWSHTHGIEAYEHIAKETSKEKQRVALGNTKLPNKELIYFVELQWNLVKYRRQCCWSLKVLIGD